MNALSAWLSPRRRILAFVLMEGGVRVWMRHPAKVMAVFFSSMFLSGLMVIWLAFHLVATAGTGSALLAAGIVLAAISLFVFFIEPWLGNTGVEFRARHACKATLAPTGQSMDYLRLLHDRMMSLRAPCHVSILSGGCPWLLAYGIEHVFDPSVRAGIQATRLGLYSPPASKPPQPDVPSRRL